MSGKSPLRIFLSGDIMTGRGIDQILMHPTDPQIYESYIQDARDYILLAECINGKIPRSTHGDYLWNDALKELEYRKPDLSLINLETSVTSKGTPCINKGIQYRMHPENIDAITTAKINVCSLANNHILDWGNHGLFETVETLDKEGIAHAGAGQNLQWAQAPAVLSTPKTLGKILIFSMGTSTSGIPKDWGATPTQAGIWLLNDLGTETVKQIKKTVECYKNPEDFCIISIHWGENWVDQIPLDHQTFAHELIDSTEVNLIHGHSSHHPMGIELYKNIPIFYGCGDLINDYEGIGNHEGFKTNLSLMYFLEFDCSNFKFKQLEIISFERKKFKLNYANNEDCQWLLNSLQKQSKSFNTHFKLRKNVIYMPSNGE